MSHINRQADKVDFLASFKKVILMPVNAIPLPPLKPVNFSFPANPFLRTSSSTSTATASGTATPQEVPESPYRSTLTLPEEAANGIQRSATPTSDGRNTPTPQTAPTTELAAKAAILNSRMEGIRTLFNIELTLDLVHKAKASLERAACFVRFGGQTGEEA
jgi:recyclin-1